MSSLRRILTTIGMILGCMSGIEPILVFGQEVVDTYNFRPFVQYINYEYSGDAYYFPSQTILVEYEMDDNALTQVCSFAYDSTAYIYQSATSGFYEVGYVDNYLEVEDLRPTAGGQKSLILPATVSVGKTYHSGYHGEVTNTVIAIEDDFEFDGTIHSQAIVIESEDPRLPTTDTFYYYYVPFKGLLKVDYHHADGSLEEVFRLLATQGPL